MLDIGSIRKETIVGVGPMHIGLPMDGTKFNDQGGRHALAPGGRGFNDQLIQETHFALHRKAHMGRETRPIRFFVRTLKPQKIRVTHVVVRSVDRWAYAPWRIVACTRIGRRVVAQNREIVIPRIPLDRPIFVAYPWIVVGRETAHRGRTCVKHEREGTKQRRSLGMHGARAIFFSFRVRVIQGKEVVG